MQPQLKPVNVMTDAELTHYIEQFETDLKVLQLEQEYRHKQAEAKALEAYWVANPQLVRLEVGDKLLMTQDKLKELPYDVRGGIYEVGVPYDVINIRLQDGKVVVEFSMIDQGVYTEAYKQEATLEETQDMRKAYLETEKG